MRYRLAPLVLFVCCAIFVILWIGGYFSEYQRVIFRYRYVVETEEESEDKINLVGIEKEPIQGEKNIIFLETKCATKLNYIKDSGLLLTKRQACSVESAAKMNPGSKVYLLYTCSINGGIDISLEHVKQLFAYPNIKIWKLDIPQFLKRTPLQGWDFQENLENSKWPVEHSSDVLRYVSLFKYGGLYLDLDIVVRKPLHELGANYLGKESSDLLAACVLNFASEGIGHEMAERCVESILGDFSGQAWNHNGPDLVTRVLQKLCNVEKVEEMNRESCRGFKLLPEKDFTPLGYPQWGLLFTSVDIQDVMEKVNSSYGVHAWNSMSKEGNCNLMIQQPYGLLALHFCPRVHAHSDINF